jgi:hypothetical protein
MQVIIKKFHFFGKNCPINFKCAFNANDRKDWLNKFGGIKVFRDDFRVRPYGEAKDSAFDWLGLGSRKAKSQSFIFL